MGNTLKSRKEWLFDVPGKYSLLLPTGEYLFECWGASGGAYRTNGGRGAYVSGVKRITNSVTFYLFVGEQGKRKNNSKTFNGGGGAFYDSQGHPGSYSSSGGGATDVRLIDGKWDDFSSLKSRIIVAGGGGGESLFASNNGLPAQGGHGGAYSGQNGSYSICGGCQELYEYQDAEGGQQSRPGNKGGGGGYLLGNNGQFGIGGTANKDAIGLWPSSGSGGGYFGGGSGGVTTHCLGSGSGGSSFVSGMVGCMALDSSSTAEAIVFNGNIHHSGMFFHFPEMKGGEKEFYSPYGAKEKGHLGNGAILITYLDAITKKHLSNMVNIPAFIMFCS